MVIEVVSMRFCKDAGKRDGDLRIDRMSMFGNPFPIGKCKEGNVEKQYDRAGCIARYEQYLRLGEVIVVNGRHWDGLRVRQEIKRLAKEGKVKRLLCWCKPLPCHGDVIARIMEEAVS